MPDPTPPLNPAIVRALAEIRHPEAFAQDPEQTQVDVAENLRLEGACAAPYAVLEMLCRTAQAEVAARERVLREALERLFDACNDDADGIPELCRQADCGWPDELEYATNQAEVTLESAFDTSALDALLAQARAEERERWGPVLRALDRAACQLLAVAGEDEPDERRRADVMERAVEASVAAKALLKGAGE